MHVYVCLDIQPGPICNSVLHIILCTDNHFVLSQGKLKQLKLDNGVPVDAAANTKKVPAEEKQEEKEST